MSQKKPPSPKDQPQYCGELGVLKPDQIQWVKAMLKLYEQIDQRFGPDLDKNTSPDFD